MLAKILSNGCVYHSPVFAVSMKYPSKAVVFDSSFSELIVVDVCRDDKYTVLFIDFDTDDFSINNSEFKSYWNDKNIFRTIKRKQYTPKMLDEAKEMLRAESLCEFKKIAMGANNSISLTDSEMYLGREGQGGNTLAGTITLTNSTLSSLGKLNSTAAITMDETSSITATTITGTGTITIDVKGYTGDTYKAIDVNSAISNTVKLTNTGNNYYLTCGDDGDVFVTKSPEFVYVSSDYNSSTEGWGVTKFGSWDGAYAFTSTNAKKATIVFEKTTTISGNCFPKQADGVAAIIVKDGASVGNANSKWDAVFAMTIEAGGILQSVRHSHYSWFCI